MQNAEIGKTATGMESFGETLHPFLIEDARNTLAEVNLARNQRG
jgi:hypothetical protein